MKKALLILGLIVCVNTNGFSVETPDKSETQNSVDKRLEYYKQQKNLHNKHHAVDFNMKIRKLMTDWQALMEDDYFKDSNQENFSNFSKKHNEIHLLIENTYKAHPTYKVDRILGWYDESLINESIEKLAKGMKDIKENSKNPNLPEFLSLSNYILDYIDAIKINIECCDKAYERGRRGDNLFL